MESVLGNADILKLLFGQLDLSDLCRVSSVCQLWRSVSCADEFWRNVSFDGRYLYPAQVQVVPSVGSCRSLTVPFQYSQLARTPI